MAVAQRTLASTQAMSGSPTTKNPGNPSARSTWTSMGRALVPRSAAQRKEACTRGDLCERRAGAASERRARPRGVSNPDPVPDWDRAARSAPAPPRNEDRSDYRDGSEEDESPSSVVGAERRDAGPRDLGEPAHDRSRPQRRRQGGEDAHAGR